MGNKTQNSAYGFVTPVKLDQNNFISWRTQVLASIKGNGLEGFINGDFECPNQFLSSENNNEAVNTGNNNGAPVSTTDGSRSINPEFTGWIKTDQILLS